MTNDVPHVQATTSAIEVSVSRIWHAKCMRIATAANLRAEFGETVMGDQIRAWLSRQVGEPPNFRSWGLITKRLAVLGILVGTEVRRPSRSKANHRQAAMVWRIKHRDDEIWVNARGERNDR